MKTGKDQFIDTLTRKMLLMACCCLFLLLLFSPLVHGQIQRVDSVGGKQVKGLSGQVVDSARGIGIPFAHVFLIGGNDTVKLAADVDGCFSYAGELPGSARLQVTAIGYRALEALYSPVEHGSYIRIFLQRDTASLDRVEVASRGSNKEYPFIMQFPMDWCTIIDEHDTMFMGFFPWEAKRTAIQLICSVFPNHFDIRSFSYYEYIDTKRFLEEARRTPDPEVTKRVAAAREELSRLRETPDREFAVVAKARGVSPKRYRREQVQILEDLIAKMEERNSQAYIDKTLADAEERLRRLNALKEEIAKEKYKFKHHVASMTIDGKLYNYNDWATPFNRGLLPVYQRDKENERRRRWGVINDKVQEVVPCRYGWISNIPYSREEGWRIGWGNKIEMVFYYPDPRGWITVGDFYNLHLMGMVDREGKERIPLRFVKAEGRHRIIEFFSADVSEEDFAPVTVQRNGKLLDGIIDRSGNFTLAPVHETPIFWDKKRQCFYTGDGKARIYFDARGKKL